MIRHHGLVGRASVRVDRAIGNAPACADLEALLRAIPGVHEATVNGSTGSAFIRFDATQSCHVRILDALIEAGYLDSGDSPSLSGLACRSNAAVEAVLVSCIDVATD